MERNLLLSRKPIETLESLGNLVPALPTKSKQKVDPVFTLSVPMEPLKAVKLPARVVAGDAADELFSVMLTVDMTMSNRLLVRARDRNHALELAREFASSNQEGFEIDEGNYRGGSDYYLGDSDEGIQPLSDETNADGDDMFAQISVYSREGYELRASLSRLEPDCSDGDRCCACEFSIAIADTDFSYTTEESVAEGSLREHLSFLARSGELQELAIKHFAPCTEAD